MELEQNNEIIALLEGPDRPGIVASVAGWIHGRGGNIAHADQHRDSDAGVFFQRVAWQHPTSDEGDPIADFTALAATLGMRTKVFEARHRPKIAVFVSKFDHCFHDILLRWKGGEFAGDISLVLSNHETLARATEGYGVPFYHVAVSPQRKHEAEAEQLRILREHGIELVVMARYMQILSDDFLSKSEAPVINIHHSFLPAFAGARPYHQAFRRGVKIIGATAHYATADLDEGPIIQQEVLHVNHRHGVSDLIRKGRDLEKVVLAQAVRWHLEHRILVYGNKTVVFD
jgi:formyltetrahydrofolate deformylase